MRWVFVEFNIYYMELVIYVGDVYVIYMYILLINKRCMLLFNILFYGFFYIC